MTRTAPTGPATKPKTLVQQNSDFTSEGAPPPGKVATQTPVTPNDPRTKAPQPAPSRKGGG